MTSTWRIHWLSSQLWESQCTSILARLRTNFSTSARMLSYSHGSRQDQRQRSFLRRSSQKTKTHLTLSVWRVRSRSSVWRPSTSFKKHHWEQLLRPHPPFAKPSVALMSPKAVLLPSSSKTSSWLWAPRSRWSTCWTSTCRPKRPSGWQMPPLCSKLLVPTPKKPLSPLPRPYSQLWLLRQKMQSWCLRKNLRQRWNWPRLRQLAQEPTNREKKRMTGIKQERRWKRRLLSSCVWDLNKFRGKERQTTLLSRRLCTHVCLVKQPK